MTGLQLGCPGQATIYGTVRATIYGTLDTYRVGVDDDGSLRCYYEPAGYYVLVDSDAVSPRVRARIVREVRAAADLGAGLPPSR